MLLNESEKYKVLALCRIVYNDTSIKHSAISRRDTWRNGNEYLRIKLGKTKAYLDVSKSDYYTYEWTLYVGGTKIGSGDDGAWWDIVRTEVPKLDKELYDERLKRLDDECEEHRRVEEYNDLQRAKELQRAEDYINGWRWWKLWW